MMASLAIVPLCVFPVRYIGKKLVKRAYEMQTQMGSVTNSLSENLGAAKEIRAFGLEARQAQAFAQETSALIHVQVKVAKYAQALTPAIEIISSFAMAIVFVFAYRGNVKLVDFLSIITAVYISYDAIKRLGAINNEIKRGEAALNRLEVVFGEPVTIKDPPNPANVGRVHGDIAFEGVGFAYKTDEPVLKGVSAMIPAGTVCALVGPSGAGKTTFANLVPRFFDVGTGHVAIDGTDIREMRLADLRGNIAVVSQDPVLFNDTVHNNLLLGRLNATPEEVRAAARNAHADEFIRSFPLGYETIVGERGARLSGGQKQRLALARAFLRNAPILILDEATSALDSQSEQMIQDALRKLVVGKTVVIIAHRFSTIRDASLILVFDQGSIVARGDHTPALCREPPLPVALRPPEARVGLSLMHVIGLGRIFLLNFRGLFTQKASPLTMETGRPPEHKVIITGTGRAGTTFLVRLLGALGLDTGISERNFANKYFEQCNAGLEHEILDRKTPYIVKNPALCKTLGPALATGRFVIDHAYIPIRELDSVAASRAAVGGVNGSRPGGLWCTSDAAKQGAVMGELFHQLVHTLVVNEIPHTFILFPRMVTDPAYTYQRLEFLMKKGISSRLFGARLRARPTRRSCIATSGFLTSSIRQNLPCLPFWCRRGSCRSASGASFRHGKHRSAERRYSVAAARGVAIAWRLAERP